MVDSWPPFPPPTDPEDDILLEVLRVMTSHFSAVTLISHAAMART